MFSFRVGMLLALGLMTALNPLGTSETPCQEVRNVPKAPNQPRLDLFGDPLPRGALARIGTVKFRHNEFNIAAMAFSPNGKLIASGTRGEGIYLWDVASGKEVRRIPIGPVSMIMFSSDGKLLVSWAQDQTIRFHELETGKEVRRIKTSRKGEGATAISSDAKLWAWASEDNVVHLGEMATGREIRQLAGRRQGICWPLVFSPDGTILASGTIRPPGEGNTISLWDAATGKEIRHMASPGAALFTFAFLPDGKRLATSKSITSDLNQISIWELASGKNAGSFQIQHRTPPSFAGEGRMVFSPDGKTLAFWGENVRLLNVAGGKELRSMRASGFLMTFSPDGQTLATVQDDLICLWDVASGKAKTPLPVRAENVTFSPDGKTLAGADSCFIRLWDVTTGKEIRAITSISADCLAFSPHGKTIVAGGVQMMIAWDAATGKIIRHYGKNENPRRVFVCSISPDGKWLGTGEFLVDRPRIWDQRTGKEAYPRKLPQFGFPGMVSSPPPTVEFPPPPEICSLAFSPDSQVLASGYGDGTIRLMSFANGKQIRVFGVDESAVTVAFSGDGKTVASMSNGIVRLWEAATGTERKSFPLVSGKKKKDITGFAFSQDAKQLAFAQDQLISIWDVATGKERRRFQAPPLTVTRLVFSADGQRLATEHNHSTVLIWDVEALLKPQGR
jgi:WD40 repeat protein